MLQSALKVSGPGHVHVASGIAIPSIQPGEALVRVLYVALNPVDAKSVDLSPTQGATVGCDFAGEVIEIGTAVTKSLTAGDRVCGCIFGNNPARPGNGAFAEFVAVPGDLLFRVPAEMTLQSAATLGVGLATSGLALYQALELPWPRLELFEPEIQAAIEASNTRYVLISGGGTATGTLAIQLARASGFVPVTTCSPRHFEWVQWLGAAAAFDYQSPSCSDDIKTLTGDNLKVALDCVTTSDTMRMCYAALSCEGGRYLSLDPFPIRGHTRRNVQPDWIVAFTIFDQPVNWQRPFKRDSRPQDREFAERWFATAQELLDAGRLSPHPFTEKSGGLRGVADGIDMVRKGRVAGSKLVYGVS